MTKIFFKLILGSKEYEIPSKFNHLSDISTDIYDTLIFSPDHQYTVESKVSEDVFESFLKYWVSGDIPDIRVDNFFEYSQLSDEFNLLKEQIQQKKKEFGNSLNFFKELQNSNLENISTIEKNTSANLDKYLKQYGIEMMHLPIQTLYNIFAHTDRNLKDHNLAYSLILKEYELTSNKSIFILLQTLDGSHLSQKNLKDSIFNQDLHFGYLPKINDVEYLSVFNSEEKFEQSISDLQKLANDRQSKIDQLSNEMSQIKKSRANNFNSIKTTTQNNVNMIKKLDEKYKKDILKIKNTQDEEISNLKNSIEKQTQEISKYEAKHLEDIEKLNTQINDYSDKIKSNKQNISTAEEETNKPFIKKDHQKRNPGKPINIFYNSDENDRFHGIIHYLTDECQGNVHKKGAVEVTSSSIFPKTPLLPPLPPLPGLPPLPPLRVIPDDNINPINAVDLDNINSSFISDNKPNSWICYNFIDAKVKPNAYSIRAYNNGKSHLLNWRVEGSNDNNKWTVLDERSNEHSIDDCNKCNTFMIKDENTNNFYQYIRLKQTGMNTKDNNSLCISAFELFGTFYE